MADPVITRETIMQYSDAVTGGRVPDGLFMRDVPDFIPLIGRTDTPFTKKLTTGPAWKIVKREFGSGDLVPDRTTLKTALTDGTGTTVEFDNQNVLQRYDQVYFVDTGEVIRLNTVPGAVQCTGVTRGFGSSSGAAHLAGTEVIVLGPAVPEGADTPSSPHAYGTLDWNAPQIFEYSWEATHRGRVVPDYEVKGDRFKHEMKRKMKEAAIDLENTFIYGLRSLGDGTKTNGSSTGGVREFTTHNRYELNGDPLTLKVFLDMLQEIYMRVGQGDMGKSIYGPPYLKRVINSFFHAARRTSATDAKLSIKTDTIETDFGDISYTSHYNWPRDEIHVLNMADIKRCAFEGGNWSTGLFSTYGWYDRGFLRGDFGFLPQAPERRGCIVEVSTLDADYPNLDRIP